MKPRSSMHGHTTSPMTAIHTWRTPHHCSIQLQVNVYIHGYDVLWACGPSLFPHALVQPPAFPCMQKHCETLTSLVQPRSLLHESLGARASVGPGAEAESQCALCAAPNHLYGAGGVMRVLTQVTNGHVARLSSHIITFGALSAAAVGAALSPRSA